MYDPKTAWEWYQGAYEDMLNGQNLPVLQAVFAAAYRLGADDAEEE